MSDARGAASWDAKRAQPASDAEAYAWECAENMRGWALRAEESNRELRGQLDAARQALDPATVAESFHAHYERLAPDYGYRTREESAVPWVSVPLLNKRLMVATVTEALAAARAALGVEGEADDSARLSELPDRSPATGAETGAGRTARKADTGAGFHPATRPTSETERRVATIRENVGHIARGCRASTAHNPAPYLNSIEAALTALGEADDE